MSKLDDLLKKRSVTEKALEEARKNTAEVEALRELTSLEQDIAQAERELELVRINKARAELVKLTSDIEAMLSKLVKLASGAEVEYEALVARYLAYKAEVRRFPDDLSTWSVSPSMDALNTLVIALVQWSRGVERLKK